MQIFGAFIAHILLTLVSHPNLMIEGNNS